MANFEIIFEDEFFGEQSATFAKIKDAIEYWNEYAGISSCLAGKMVDLHNNESIIEFDVREKV